ncbi:uncharacterized protein CPUR_05684 [Claviceps purpurea 20.1]|uniref:Uncharacterized protein n=1 Tax=Claviceps purpurea (strain 20.1) TaxID=1111077 RepID=M1WGI1_CLAP2|nr:uncharacterized protein CPUR_05684 [Claviceps purpurea 20.1]
MFLKWCEHPYNVWWWQHVKHISPYAATQAYGVAFKYELRQLYDTLTRLPFPVLLDDLLVKLASESFLSWSWRQVVRREFEDDFLATWSLTRGDNMIHVTVDIYIDGDLPYSAADAIQDILYLRDKGVNMNLRNAYGQTPLDVLLKSDRCKDGFMEVAAVLEGKAHKVQELTRGPSEYSSLDSTFRVHTERSTFLLLNPEAVTHSIRAPQRLFLIVTRSCTYHLAVRLPFALETLHPRTPSLEILDVTSSYGVFGFPEDTSFGSAGPFRSYWLPRVAYLLGVR